MARAWLGVLGVLLFFAACRERNPEFVPQPEGSTDASAGDSGSASSGVTSNTITSATTGETGSVSNSAGESSSTLDPESSTSELGSESGDPLVPYPACDPDGAPCPRGYTDCIVESDPPVSWCSHWCVHQDDCEPPLTGDAPAICRGHDCMLDCTDGQTCPDGMVCAMVFDDARCGWPS